MNVFYKIIASALFVTAACPVLEGSSNGESDDSSIDAESLNGEDRTTPVDFCTQDKKCSVDNEEMPPLIQSIASPRFGARFRESTDESEAGSVSSSSNNAFTFERSPKRTDSKESQKISEIEESARKILDVCEELEQQKQTGFLDKIGESNGSDEKEKDEKADKSASYDQPFEKEEDASIPTYDSLSISSAETEKIVE